MQSITIIPYKRLVNPTTGQTASMYGACPPGYRLQSTGRYTWMITENTGAWYTGLGRCPVATYAEAYTIACAAAHGAPIIDGTKDN